MRIVHIITRDDGGGGRAAYRLHSGLRQTAIDSLLYVSSQHHIDDATVVFKPSTRLDHRLRRVFNHYRLKLKMLGYHPNPGTSDSGGWSLHHICRRGAEPIAQLPKADLYNLHTIQNFFDFEAFFSTIPADVPIVWTLHTREPMTGGCLYAGACARFEQSCGCCPALNSQRENDPSREVWKRKKLLLDRFALGRLHIVSPSRWLANEASKSSLLGDFPISVIPNSVDNSAYAPRDKVMAREILGLPVDAQIVFFSSFAHKRKGIDYLLEALRRMREIPNLFLVMLGEDYRLKPDEPFGFRHFGSVLNDRLISVIYSAADVYVITSKEDNLPNVVLESMACGTPVVGFDVGGIPDMVRPGITGHLSPFGDVNALAEALRRVLNDQAHRRELADNCLAITKKDYSLQVQAGAYIALYEKLLGSAHGKASKAASLMK
ncbi:MAG: glycosyltransferase [Verrucomicrobiota bacterium]